MSATPFFFNVPWSAQVSITNAMGTTAQDLGVAVGGSTARKITAVSVASTDTASKIATLYLFKSGGAAIILGTKTIPAGAGTDGATPAVDMMDPVMIPGLPLDSDGERYIHLQAGDKIQLGLVAALTAAKILACTAIGGEG